MVYPKTTWLTMMLLLGCAGSMAQDHIEVPSTIIYHKGHTDPNAFVYLDEYCTEDETTYPWVGSVHTEGGLRGTCCLIHPQVVLTAGHLVEDGTANIVKFGLQERPVARWINHPLFKVGNVIVIDLSMGILEDPVRYIDTPTLVDEEPVIIPRGTPMTTVGFSEALKKVSRPGTFLYQGSLHNEIWNFMWFTPDYSLWFGDSGGPVIIDGRLYGILSKLEIEGSTIMGNSAVRLDILRNWIDNTIEENLY